MFNKLFLPLKLQLFAESEDTSVENQEVAELEEINPDNDNHEESEEETEIAEQSHDESEKTIQRDFQRDSAFAKIRRELEETKRQSAMLAATYQNFGFKGSPEEIIDQANAHFLQKPIEEIRNMRIETEKKQSAEAQRQAELEYYQNREIERMMSDDLMRIKKLDPTIKSWDDLDSGFFDLIQTGVDAELAFGVIQQKKQREKITAPPEIGKVNANSKVEKDYYTPEEVDKLTEKDLDNPKVWEKVRKSMTKWK